MQLLNNNGGRNTNEQSSPRHDCLSVGRPLREILSRKFAIKVGLIYKFIFMQSNQYWS